MKFAALFALIATSQAIKLRDDEPAEIDASAAQLAAAGVDVADQSAAQVEDASASAVPQYLAESKLDDGITINVLSQGSGAACAAGSKAQVQYTGALATNGEVFDSSIPSGQPISFTVGEMTMIKCWESALPQMSVGEKADLGCPAATAYGASSKPGIPANSDLIFNVEVVACDA